MKTKILISLLVIFLLSASFGGQVAHAADPQITIFVIPPVTDEKILPTTTIPDSHISNEISIVACPGEYEPASFVIRALDDIAGLEVVATDLRTGANVIPSSNIDIRIVKCWYQAGTGQDVWNDITGKFLTPELLSKDNSLVDVVGGENYVWNEAVADYTWISERQPVSIFSIPFSELSIRDSESLQPVNIPANTNKQFWITVKVPDGQVPGVYTGTIRLAWGAAAVTEIKLEVQVLPFALAKPFLIYSLCYLGTMNSSEPGISTYSKTETQFRAELRNMLEHGVSNPQLRRQVNDTLFTKALAIRQELGMADQPLFLGGCLYDASGPPSTTAELEALKAQVSQIIQMARSYGVTDVYFYGIDEATGDLLTEQRPAFQAIHEAGGKVYVTGPGWMNVVFPAVGDLVDLFIASAEPTIAEANRWHSVGHKVFSYGNPQGGVEKPETYRRNYGLLLWQRDYDGTMNFAYQWSDATNPWNDFDTSGNTRDHNFTYPATEGAIDTVQWEGWREAVDDIRYLTTLLEAIEMGRAEGKNVSAAEAWLADLKSSDLTTKNLDAVRSEMVGHILSLVSVNQPPVLNSIGDKSVDEGKLLTFTISATDLNGDPLTYSASNLPAGASFDPSTQTFSWTPDKAGTYPDIHFEVFDGELTDSEDITITVNTASPPGGGGGGGGGGGFGSGGDETPTRIYDIVASKVAKTSAEISWTTNEWSTSQVEYWASPSKFSPLDEEMVIEHKVHLTDLTPASTYLYKVMSTDEAGNLAVSDERTFTTLGAPAAFSLSALDIIPREVNIGEQVTIGVLVTNSGDAAGSYEVTLKVDDAIVATEDIIDLAGGASQKVSFTTAKDAAGIVTIDVNGISGSFVVKEAPATEISVFGVTPSYHTETHELAFATVIYEVNNLYQPTTDVELTLKVSRDGAPLEELSLLPPSVLEEDRIAGSQDYVPPQGWESGTYSFRAELYVGGKLYATTVEELEVTAASAALVFSWATLGKIIGATLVLIAVMISVILLRRRHLLQRLGQR